MTMKLFSSPGAAVPSYLFLILMMIRSSAAILRGVRGAEEKPHNDKAAFFHDSFESYAVGETPSRPWTFLNDSGSVAVAEFVPGSGNKAVRLSTLGGEHGKTAYISLVDLALDKQNRYYGRMMFYLEEAPQADLHWTFIQGTGLVKGQDYRGACRFGGQKFVGTGSQLMVNYDTPDFYGGKGPGTDCWIQASQVVMPEKKWTCAEWLFDGTGEGAELQLWLDGTSISSIQVENGLGQSCIHQDASYKWLSPDFATRLDLGWESYNKDEKSRVLWVDDVVLSEERVGCPK